ncbi:MAG: hypothetical protein LBG89_03905, partial [Rickettsiales bacterium]|nr:hypothetical protein [Rickettsiales bacterium]
MIVLAFVFWAGPAAAFDYDFDNSKVSLSGYGTLGNLSRTDENQPYLAFDWQARAQYTEDGGGAVLTLNQASELPSRYLQDLFVFIDAGPGRFEVGFTNSAAQKLGVGLVDAGGLRINNSLLIYGLMHRPNIIAAPAAGSSNNKIRASYVSKPGFFQAGAGYAAPQQDMDGSFDAGLRFKGGEAVKYSLSLGASHIFRPDGLIAEIYAPRVNAKSRDELAAGLNIQYHSWSFGVVGKGIYDYRPIGRPSDGVLYGGGIAYEILTWKASVNALRSDTGVFHGCAFGACQNTTALLSIQDKLDEIVDIWASLGKIFGDEAP